MKRLVILLTIAGSIASAAALRHRKGQDEKHKAPVQVTAQADHGAVVLTVSATGRVVANSDIDIKCKASGEVMALPFDVSDSVKKGDLLVELDPVDEERSLKQAQVSLSGSQARLAQARQNLLIAEKMLVIQRKQAAAALRSSQAHARDAREKAKRAKDLWDQQLTSDEAYGTVEASAAEAVAEEESAAIRIEELAIEKLTLEVKRQDVILAEGQVASDQIALSTAEQRLRDTKVLAPIDAVVSSRDVQIGQIISSGISNVGGGTTVLTLSDLSKVFVVASVDESDIGKVRVGQEAAITVDAYPDQRFRGKAVRIATMGETVSNVVTFETKIEVLGENKSLLKPEMTANVDIIVARATDALRVPVQAVYRRRKQQFVRVLRDDGQTDARAVTTGLSDGVRVAIREGLKEGDQVIVRKTKTQSRWRDSKGPPGSRILLGR